MSFVKLISKQNCRNGDNEKIILKYYLIESSGSNKTYGVKLEKYRMEGWKEVLEDDDYIEKVTDNYSTMLSIIKTLARNIVTPYTLVEIVDELIS